MEVRFSPLFFILIDLCENVLHKKYSRTPFKCVFPTRAVPRETAFFVSFAPGDNKDEFQRSLFDEYC